MGILHYDFPAVGVETGTWKVVLESEDSLVEGIFDVFQPTEPTIRSLPDLTIDPFNYEDCMSYSVGEKVIIAGSGFPPNRQEIVGLYQQDPSKYIELESVHLAELIEAFNVKTGLVWNVLVSLPNLRKSKIWVL